MESPGIRGYGVCSNMPYHKVDKVTHWMLKTKGVEFDHGSAIRILVSEHT